MRYLSSVKEYGGKEQEEKKTVGGDESALVFISKLSTCQVKLAHGLHDIL